MQKKKIAILRGGKSVYDESLKSGGFIIVSLSKYLDKIDLIDVIIDREGNWFERGVPSDAHRSLSKVDYYIDLTRDIYGLHHDLAKKINLKNIFLNNNLPALKRVDIKRLLSQIDIDTPRHLLIRKNGFLQNQNNYHSILRDLWTKFHPPIVVKGNSSLNKRESFLTYSFVDMYKKVLEILDSGDDVLIEEYVFGKYFSASLIPNYEEDEHYLPIPVEIINKEAKDRVIRDRVLREKFLISHDHHKRPLIFKDKTRIKDKEIEVLERLESLLKDIHKTLSPELHFLVDFVFTENGKVKVLEVHTDPHIYEDSRFGEILRNSGVDIGKYVLNKIEKAERLEGGRKLFI